MGDAGMSAGPATFGALVRRYRQAAVLSQEGLAERAGLSVDAISVIERGKRGAPRPGTVALLAHALDLSPTLRADFVAAARTVSVPPETLAAPAHASPLTFPPLPTALTAFVGREREVAAIRARLLESGTRLLTLTGPAGVGKTRLALEVAALVRDDGAFPDGVAFVPLAALTDVALALPTIAHVLGLGEVPSQTPVQTLATTLADGRVLLVLDNLEQILGVAPDLGELLATAPRMMVLATSRARLNVRGERVAPVAPLTLPDPNQAPRLDANGLPRFDAVRLFVDRARDALPDFALTEQNARVVAAICRRLDGLPLALELAAARLGQLSPVALLRQLEGSLALLAGGARDLPRRQQTVRDTIAWSYDLLSVPDQLLFRRLSVFAGGCTVEAADAVCRVLIDHRPGGDALTQLVGLAEQSMVGFETKANGELRVALLETLRVYAVERAEAAGETEALRRRHAEYYSSLADRAGPYLHGSGEKDWLDRLVQEVDNLRAALRWTETHDAAAAARLANALWWFWYARGDVGEGRAWLDRILARRAGVGDLEYSCLLYRAGMMAWRQGDYERMNALGEESLTLSAAFGATGDRAFTLCMLAMGSATASRTQRLLEQGLAEAREAGDDWTAGMVFYLWGTMTVDRGDYGRARALLDESLRLIQACDDNFGRAYILSGLASLAEHRGDLRQAVALATESVTLCRAMGYKVILVDVIPLLGRLVHARGDHESAAAMARESLDMSRDVNDRISSARNLTQLGWSAYQDGAYGRAYALFVESLAVCRQMDDPRVVIENLAVCRREACRPHLSCCGRAKSRL
jgi:predicted ATPase/DNA-binding XRE family transcriptional regulator